MNELAETIASIKQRNRLIESQRKNLELYELNNLLEKQVAELTAALAERDKALERLQYHMRGDPGMAMDAGYVARILLPIVDSAMATGGEG